MDILKYQYDAENLKVALKCRYLHICPYGFMNEKGNYTAREMVSFVRRADFGKLPQNLCAAASICLRTLNDSETAHVCDLMIERAALLDMIAGCGVVAHLYSKENISSYNIAK